MRQFIRLLDFSNRRCPERHYCHRYVLAVESLVDAGLFNDAMTRDSDSSAPEIEHLRRRHGEARRRFEIA
jgi:hypothetical protein